jgi:outer membrane receptor protein involved in Fe transport
MTDTGWAGRCLLAFALGVTTHAAADAATIRGTVRDAQGAAIAGATIDIGCGPERRRVTTSSTGEFAVDDVPESRCSVTAASDLFEPETVLADATTGRSVVLVLQVRRFASEVVVTPARGVQESTFRVPDPISVTSRRDLETRPFAIVTQALREEPGILMQQTTSAQTSPIIRGFTGQSNVYLVDGVRLNQGVWRPGPSQYTAWLDPGVVDSIEVVRGGGSVQYGSDALGGTIQFLTAPTLLGLSTARVRGNVEVTGSTADQSYGGQADVSLNPGRLSIRVGGSRYRMNDLRAGGGLDSHSALTRFLGLPSTVLDNRQRGTSFNQGGAYVIVDAVPQSGATLHGLFMHQTQTGASRYDRLLGGEGLFRSGFDPQTLELGVLRYAKTDAAGLNGGISATFSVNRQSDGRYEQSRPTTRIDRQSGVTTAIGYQLQAHHDFASRYQLLAGGEYYDEETTDARRELVEPDGTIAPARPDIPNGTSYRGGGLFAQQTADLIPDRLSVRGGLRFSRYGFSTVPDPAFGVTEEQVTMQAVTFQAGALVNVHPNVSVTANVGRAFRAANTADLGNIGLTGGGGFEITPTRAAQLGALVGSTGGSNAVSTGERVPALKPEVVYQYELGVKTRVGRFSGSINGFDMELFDFIQRRALVFDTNVVGTVISGFQVVRQDAAGLSYIAQDVRPIATRVNVDRARVVGFDTEGELRVTSAWTTSAYFSVTNGRALPEGEFLRRMPPAMGGAKVRWTGSRLWAEGVVSFAAEQTRLNSGDLGDARIGAIRTRASIASFFNGGATDLGLVRNGILVETGETLAQVQNRLLGSASSGTVFTSHPGFVTVGARAGVKLPSGFDVAVIVENLGDVNYRLYGSGVDAPGFNLQVRTRYRF